MSTKPEAEMPQAVELVQRCLDQRPRAEIAGPEHGTLGARIRTARLVPYQAVIGVKEVADDQAALRLRDGRCLEALPTAEVLTRIGALIDANSTDLWDTDTRG